MVKSVVREYALSVCGTSKRQFHILRCLTFLSAYPPYHLPDTQELCEEWVFSAHISAACVNFVYFKELFFLNLRSVC